MRIRMYLKYLNFLLIFLLVYILINLSLDNTEKVRMRMINFTVVY